MPTYYAIPSRREARKVTKKLATGRSSEHDQQALLIGWARTLQYAYPDLRWLHAIPNGAKLPYKKDKDGNRYAPQALKLQAEGLTPGVSDLFLPVARQGFHGLYIEMKWGRNTTSAEQDEFIAAVRANGYRAEVTYGFEAARAVLVDYLGLPERLLEE